MDDLLRILAVLALIGANAFFVIGEFAVVAGRRSGLQPDAEAGSRSAQAALRLMDDPVRVISTVQVGITALGIATGALSEPLVRGLLGDAIPAWLAIVIAFTIVTYLSVLFGELVPKALTLDRAETLARIVARPIEMVSRVLSPVVFVLERSAEVVLKPFGVTEIVAGESIRSAEELRALVDEAEESGVIPRAQEELLHNIFDFATREVRDIMVPASEAVWLDAALLPDAALDAALDTPHGRYPVAQGSLDHVVGIVVLPDLIAAARGRREGVETVADLARPALMVPETKDVGALLRELREQRQQLAVVVDEYGATAGIVALEDVLEEIVGEIEDEFDLPDATLHRIDERTIEVAGSITIDDFNEEVGTTLPQRSARTLAGLVFEELGRRPKVGDAVSIDGVALRIAELDGLRISRLRVELSVVG
ncbi:MAG: HlyC/CorC family transporter [Conexibacter sp.]|nr:HlyC/CorC family transporter [Conexibacter sp.]